MVGAFFVLPWIAEFWLLLPLTVVLGFGLYAMHNTLQTRATEMAPDARASGIALFAVALFLGQSVGIEIAAWAIAWTGYTPVFVVSGAVLGLLALLIRHHFHRM